MSTAQDSIPPTRRTGDGRTRNPNPAPSSSSSSRRAPRGASASSGGGRRANFGGSLTGSDNNTAAANGANGAKANRSRSNHSRPSRPKVTPTEPNEPEQPPPQQHDDGSQAAEQTADEDNENDDDQLPPETETCFICADPVKLTSLPPCDHRTCHICALRLLVLYKKDECTFCKAKFDRLIFTSSSTKNFADFSPADIPYSDHKLPISFESKEALEETALLLRFNCPDPNCDIACTGWKDFKAHIRRDHNRRVCHLCIAKKRIFAHEHTLHTDQSLAAHQKAEHRLCAYDNALCYDDDELFAHMRDHHEQCHICKARGSEEERWKYYRDYDMLERHFRHAHWLCENQQCLAEKFQVFESEVDFKAHQLERHANELSNRERREALRIEANFSYDDNADSGRHAGASGGGRSGGAGRKGKGRANGGGDSSGAASGSENRDVLGVSALASRAHVPGAGPANHASRRAMFGAGLTTPAPPAVSADAPRTRADERSVEERHQAYMDKVSRALGGGEARIASFRAAVRAYKNGESSARDLISTLHVLVGEMDECAPLVNGLVDLLDDKDKSSALGDAWAGYRIERTQFPSLTPAGSSGGAVMMGGGYAGAGGRGSALRSIKKSSAASSQVWDNVERAASASSGHGAGKPVALREHFPSLGSASTATGSVGVPGSLAHAVAHNAAARASAPAARWSGASSAVGGTSGGVVAKPFVARVHTASRGMATTSKAAFPSLPTNAAKKAINEHKKTLFNKGSGMASPAVAAGSAGATPGGSGTSTPWMPQPGRIDDLPEMQREGGVRMDGLREALVASQRDDGAARKKKGKGVQVMTFGGVHRG